MSDDLAWSAPVILLGMIFSENRFTLCANAALRVTIMPYQ